MILNSKQIKVTAIGAGSVANYLKQALLSCYVAGELEYAQ
jgi:hypothetical protein